MIKTFFYLLIFICFLPYRAEADPERTLKTPEQITQNTSNSKTLEMINEISSPSDSLKAMAQNSSKNPERIAQNTSSSKSFRTIAQSPSSSSPSIITDNKSLLKKLNKHFQKKTLSRSEIQNFLLKNNYYQSEVTRKGTNYIISHPIQFIFVFKKNKFFRDKELRKQIQIDKDKMGIFFYTFIENAIKSAYQNQGFLKTEIKKTSVKKGWKEWIYLDILEGPRFQIAELKIKGLLSRPNKEYENFIRNNSSDLIKKGYFSKQDLKKGYENLINYLKNQGYLQSKIYSDRIFFKDGKAFVTIQLEEGPLTVIKDIQIQNAKALSNWEILSYMQSRIQSPLQIDLLQTDLDNIEKLYKEKGYLNAQIKNKNDVIKYTPGEKYADIVIELEEGPQIFVSKIDITGLKKAKKSMVLSLFQFQPGDILTPSKKKKSIQELGATGLFTGIRLDENIVSDQLEVSARFQERKLQSLRGGFGINSERGITTRAYSEFTHRNLFGWGRAFAARGNTQVNLAQRDIFLEYEVSGRYKEVFVPRYGYQGNINLTESRDVFNYTENNINFVKKTQVSFFINKNWGDDLKMRWNVLSFESRREDCTQIICPENPQKIGSVGFNVIWDKRDNIFDPSYGILSSLTTEWADPVFNSDDNISFVKADFQNQLYWTFLKKYTLALTLKGGMIQATNDRQYIPVSRSFILGGKNSIRGYDGNIEGERIPNRKTAPINTANEALRLQMDDNIENVLISRYGLLNIDLRIPMFNNFKGIGFYDLGAVYLQGKQQKITNYGHSIGMGFRYQTFLMPIGLDIAYKLPPKEGSEYRFHLSIGW